MNPDDYVQVTDYIAKFGFKMKRQIDEGINIKQISNTILKYFEIFWSFQYQKHP